MPLYLHQWNYKDTQVRDMLEGAEPLDREGAIRSMIKAFGGELQCFYFCIGAYDGVAISEFPDEKSALGCAMAIYGEGRVQSLNSTQLFSAAKSKDAIMFAREVLGIRA
jgi:uncharacterized protein with GYD domain